MAPAMRGFAGRAEAFNPQVGGSTPPPRAGDGHEANSRLLNYILRRDLPMSTSILFCLLIKRRNPVKVYLKVKIKSLATEARIIRMEERKSLAQSRKKGTTPHMAYWGLRSHRTGIVREEARYSQIAYAYLRGRPYRITEKTDRTPDWARVVKVVSRFGGPTNLTPTALEDWAAT